MPFFARDAIEGDTSREIRQVTSPVSGESGRPQKGYGNCQGEPLRPDVLAATATTQHFHRPLVSVIIPTYNRAHLLGRAIRSVLAQTYRDYELIVIDDGSTDDTVDVVRRFKDDRIKYIRHDKNRGGAAARNTGIDAARGEYLAFLDSDDEWFSEKLQRHIDVFGDLPATFGVTYTAGYLVSREGTRTRIPRDTMKPKSGDIHKDIMQRSFVDTVSAMVRKECFAKCGLFDESLPKAQDHELWMRVSEHYHFRYLREPLYNSHLVSDSVYFDENARLVSNKIILEKHGEEIRQYPQVLAERLHTVGNLLCQKGELREGRQYLVKAVRVNPPAVKSLVAFLVSLAGSPGYKAVVRLKRRLVRQRPTICE